jgi:hypothetical protein
VGDVSELLVGFGTREPLARGVRSTCDGSLRVSPGRQRVNAGVFSDTEDLFPRLCVSECAVPSFGIAEYEVMLAQTREGDEVWSTTADSKYSRA